MERIDNTYWTDGVDIFYRMGDEWIKVTGEDSTVDPKIVDSGILTVKVVKQK